MHRTRTVRMAMFPYSVHLSLPAPIVRNHYGLVVQYRIGVDLFLSNRFPCPFCPRSSVFGEQKDLHHCMCVCADSIPQAHKSIPQRYFGRKGKKRSPKNKISNAFLPISVSEPVDCLRLKAQPNPKDTQDMGGSAYRSLLQVAAPAEPCPISSALFLSHPARNAPVFEALKWRFCLHLRHRLTVGCNLHNLSLSLSHLPNPL